jgi:hypothetical protein
MLELHLDRQARVVHFELMVVGFTRLVSVSVSYVYYIMRKKGIHGVCGVGICGGALNIWLIFLVWYSRRQA